MLSGKPLGRETGRFMVGRDQQSTSARAAVANELNLLVVGEPGSGRTSFVQVLAAELREARSHRVFMVRAGASGGIDDLVRAIAHAVLDDGQFFDCYRGTPAPADVIRSIGRRLEHDLAAVGGDEKGPYWEPGSPAVIMIDDAPPLVLGQLLLALRDELWLLPAVWIAAVTPDAAGMFSSSPAGVFWEVVLDFPPLTEQECVALLQLRLAEPFIEMPLREELLAIAAQSEGNPRRLITTARSYLKMSTGPVRRFDIPAELERRNATQAKALAMGRGHAMLISVMQGLGGTVSASDERLLSSLGWSRTRAAQVLRDLEEQGYATTSTPPRSDGLGRPRKVYTLIEELR